MKAELFQFPRFLGPKSIRGYDLGDRGELNPRPPVPQTGALTN